MVLSAQEVKERALRAGFHLVGLARAEPLPAAALERWLEQGYAAGMGWMAARREERLDPSRVLPGARTVVALAQAYRQPASDPARPFIARYARGRDYHATLKDQLRALRRSLLEIDPGVETYACVDTGPVMEKAWAEKAGIGWIGKNGCLITRSFGSWVLLAAMYLDREVDRYDEPHDSLCGDCALCLSACPTGAFPSPGVVDAGRCISYQTIENRGPVPRELWPALKGHAFGCDLCQEVCPFNRPVGPEDRRFASRPVARVELAELAGMGEPRFRELCKGTAVARAKYDGLRRNALLAMGQAPDAEGRAVAMALRGDPRGPVREAAAWVLGEEQPLTDR